MPKLQLFLVIFFISCNMYCEDIDWHFRLKQCVTSHIIHIFSSTMSKKFLASLHSPYLLKSNIQRYNFLWRYKKQCNVLFWGLNSIQMREKESLECRGMHICALKTQKLPGPLSGPWPLRTCFARATPLCYISNFRPWKLGSPLTKSWQKQSKLRRMTRMPRSKREVRKQISSINSGSLWTFLRKIFKIILATFAHFIICWKKQWKMPQTDSMSNKVFAVWILYSICLAK